MTPMKQKPTASWGLAGTIFYKPIVGRQSTFPMNDSKTICPSRQIVFATYRHWTMRPVPSTSVVGTFDELVLIDLLFSWFNRHLILFFAKGGKYKQCGSYGAIQDKYINHYRNVWLI